MTAVASPDATQVVATQPRTSAATTSRLSNPGDSGSRNDPYGETLVHRAVSRRNATPVGIVVTGDSHLGAALPNLSPARRTERRERLRRGFSAAVDYAVQHGARLFVIAGDLFDNPLPSNAERAFVAGELARLRRAGVACVAVGGNHDSPRASGGEQGGESPYQTYAALESMLYFPATSLLTPRLLTIGDLRLAVAGISTDPTAPGGSDPLAGIRVADAEHTLPNADLGLLLIHAGIEGFAQPDEDERIVARASLEALPPAFRIVVAGHAHRFGRAQVGEREVIVPGSTERMGFDARPGSSGFAWLEATPDGLTRVRRITVAEQPRADIELETAQLFPGGPGSPVGAAESGTRIPALPSLPVLTASAQPGDEAANSGTYHLTNGNGFANSSANGLQVANGTVPAPGDSSASQRGASDALLATLRRAVDEVGSDETLVRLRLVGPISRAQYHLLPLRELERYGNAHTFAFELDTSGLELVEPSAPQQGARTGPGSSAASGASGVQRAPTLTGPLSPAVEVERLLQDRLTRVSPDDSTAVADLHAAASILLARLRASGGASATTSANFANSSGSSSDREADS